jgi:hypothetical protein
VQSRTHAPENSAEMYTVHSSLTSLEKRGPNLKFRRRDYENPGKFHLRSYDFRSEKHEPREVTVLLAALEGWQSFSIKEEINVLLRGTFVSM